MPAATHYRQNSSRRFGWKVRSFTADVAPTLRALSARVDAAVAELRTIDVTTLGNFRGVGRAQLPSTVIGCLVHGAEHAMRHVGQLSVTARIVRSGIR
jgi:hypothetical protein